VASAAAWVLVVLANASACSSNGGGANGSSGNSSCRKVCVDRCNTAAACPSLTVPSTCVDDCSAQLVECDNAPPANQFSCDELKSTLACSSYCGEICRRAPQCGSFDEASCMTGCGDVNPPICNPLSVAARSCDQLKPELRLYQEAGQAKKNGETFVGVVGGDGLCSSNIECQPGTVCDMTTNVCSKCKSNADCSGDLQNIVCASDGACVQCVVDSDCKLQKYAPPQFVKCTPDSHTCVECLTDADCTIAPVPHCNVSTGFCGS
jgi:hypothetical protein